MPAIGCNGPDLAGYPMTQQDTAQDLVYLPLGGAGEIGMNAYLYGFGPEDARQWLLVDCGIGFTDQTMPGIEVVVPDLSFLESERASLCGIVLTHAHEDHYGALARFWPALKAPVYASGFAAHLLYVRLDETGLAEQVTVERVGAGETRNIGPFEVEFVHLAHSIPEAMGLAIKTPLGLVFHTGDWKFDTEPALGKPADVAALERLGRGGCLALVCDSTNILRPGASRTEREVAETLSSLIANAEKNIAITTFASNLGRIISVLKAADAAGRTVVALGRAMWRIIEAGRAAGYLEGLPPIADIDALDDLPQQNCVFLITGSQGENRAALARIAKGEYSHGVLGEGDVVVFSSHNIPGNEKAVGRVQNDLARLGARVITDADQPVHTSGHPRPHDLARLYELLKPDIIVPMHGEPRHLREHARFAAETSGSPAPVVENGQMLRLAPGPVTIIDEVPHGRLFADGNLLVPAENGPVRARRKLAFGGLVTVSVVLDRKNRLIGDAQVGLFGLPTPDDAGIDFESLTLDMVERVLDEGARTEVDLAEVMRLAVRREIEAHWGKRPLVQIVCHRLDGTRHR
jgi:ribonuclease J